MVVGPPRKVSAHFLAKTPPLVFLVIVLVCIDVAPSWARREGVDDYCCDVVEVGFSSSADVDVVIGEIGLLRLLLWGWKCPCLIQREYERYGDCQEESHGCRSIVASIPQLLCIS